jgi:hypothetical protein
MRLVDEADRAPRKCAVSGRPNGPFIDFQVDVRAPTPNTPNFLYLHASVVKEAAQKLGMVPKAKLEKLQGRVTEMETELAELRESMRVFAEFEDRFPGKTSEEVLDDLKASVAA